MTIAIVIMTLAICIVSLTAIALIVTAPPMPPPHEEGDYDDVH